MVRKAGHVPEAAANQALGHKGNSYGKGRPPCKLLPSPRRPAAPVVSGTGWAPGENTLPRAHSLPQNQPARG